MIWLFIFIACCAASLLENLCCQRRPVALREGYGNPNRPYLIDQTRFIKVFSVAGEDVYGGESAEQVLAHVNWEWGGTDLELKDIAQEDLDSGLVNVTWSDDFTAAQMPAPVYKNYRWVLEQAIMSGEDFPTMLVTSNI